MTRRATAVMLAMLVAADARAAAVPQAPERDCDDIYYGAGRRPDFSKALACYRAEADWLMVAVMQLNGEGGAADVAGARATFQRYVVEQADADAEMFEKILKRREAGPGAKNPRIDFCKDVAATTLSMNRCQRRSGSRKSALAEKVLGQLRAKLDKASQAPFDRVLAAAGPFAKAEAERAYQEYVDGSIRDEFSMSQQALVRENFIETVKKLTSSDPAPPAGKRPLAEADAELNALYQDNLRAYAATYEPLAAESKDPGTAALYRGYVRDYRSRSQRAQHEWVKYRDAMGKLAAARWPGVAGAESLGKALVTEDRIRELRSSESG